MTQEPVVIPEKIYFKIGEVCELVGVQAHVLRYWETEFSMLSPQKNKSGQRSYRRKDVEIALRIKQLLYNEMFTIAGAKKKLQAESRESSKSKPVNQTERPKVDVNNITAPTLFDDQPGYSSSSPASITADTTTSIHGGDPTVRVIALQLIEIRDLLRAASN